MPLLASLALLLVGTTLGALLGGTSAAVGAAAGVGVVTISYTMSVLIISWGDSINPNLVLPFGMGAYVLKFTWIGMIMWVLATHGWAGLPAMGFGVVAGVIVWTTAQIVTVVRTGPHSKAASDGS